MSQVLPPAPSPAPEAPPEGLPRPPARGKPAGTRRTFLRLALALLVFVGLNALAVALKPRLLHVINYRQGWVPSRIVEYQSAPRQDVLFLGSSRTGVAFDPALTEREVARRTGARIHAFNLGLDGCDVTGAYLILKNVISDAKRPTVIVYGLSEFETASTFDDYYTFVPYTPDYMVPQDFAVYSGPTLQTKMDFVARQAVPLYGEHELIHDALSIMYSPDDPAHAAYLPGPNHFVIPHDDFHTTGYARPGATFPSGGQAGVDEAGREYAVKLRAYAFNERRIALLESFLDLARARGIKVVLVDMPVTPMQRAFWHSPAKIAAYQARVQDIARRHGVPLLDLYTTAQRYFPVGDFIDTHHLNESGADTLTRMVARDYLAGLFPGGQARRPSRLADAAR